VTRVGSSVGFRVEFRVGFRLDDGCPAAETGRAAELASEAARAEGASLPATASGRRAARQTVKHEWLGRFDLRGGGLPDIRA